MRKGYRLLFTLLLSFILSPASAQFYYVAYDSVIVKDSVDTIDVPWVGGFQSPQFSTADFNNDGIEDLFVHDKSGSTVATFLNGGDSGKVDYDYAPQYIKNVPHLESFALMYDYNCDGAADLFTGMNLGMRVYKGEYVNNELTWPGLAVPLMYGQQKLVYLQFDDLPVLEDIDGDGDMDVLSFHVDGIGVQYYKNRSVQEGMNCDTLWFDLITDYWGDFEETGSSLEMDLHKGHNKKGNGSRDPGHAGSTITAIDHDDDGDMDLLVGDISFNEMNMLTNGGTADSAEIDSQDIHYPSYDVPINFHGFPGAFHLDLNNDSFKDLVLSPNRSNFAHNYMNVWYYKNVDTTGKVILEFQTDRFLSDQMIEVGEASYPVLFDHDGDSLLDLIIGNYGYFEDQGQGETYWGRLTHFKNIGTASEAAFEFVTDDYAGLGALGIWGLVPAFGDLDGDGDMDMIVGESEGKLMHYENTAGAGNPASFTLVTAALQGLDVGYFSTPQLVNVNKDSLVDLVVGERQGSLNYYENQGSKTTPAFKTIASPIWGGVDVRSNALTGYSVPKLVQLDTTEEWFLAVGNEEGQIYLFGVIDSNIEGIFVELDTAFSDIDVGLRAAPEFADLNSDGKLDLLVGSLGGGVRYYDGSSHEADSMGSLAWDVYNPIIEQKKKDIRDGIGINKTDVTPLLIFPNPATSKAFVKLDFDHEIHLELINIVGATVASSTNFGEGYAEIDLSGMAPGTYFVRVKGEKGVQTGKLVVY